MDLSSMLNNGPAPGKRVQEQRPLSSDVARASMGAGIQHPAQVGYATSRADQQASFQGMHSNSNMSGLNRGLTPLQTPSHSHPSASYPFPNQTAQSPGPTPSGNAQYWHDLHTATTPGPKPSSHGHIFVQPSPSHGMATLTGTLSHSPTPSSHHSQTPHSVRQSPLASYKTLPGQQHNGSYQQQIGQPTTPLGPPPSLHRNASGFDRSSPYHGRTLSTASANVVGASPAQHQPSISNLLESPVAVAHQSSPQRRSASEYANIAERERSASVSPKTRLPVRAPSLQSHTSSQADMHSARSSVQPSVHASSLSDLSAPSKGSILQGHAHPAQSHRNSSLESGMNSMHTPVPELTAAGPPLEDDIKDEDTRTADLQHMLVPNLKQETRSISPVPVAQDRAQGQNALALPNTSGKRPAESDDMADMPAKKTKTVYTTRPIWAELDRRNPRFVDDGTTPAAAPLPDRPPKQAPFQAPEAAARPPADLPHENGNHTMLAATHATSGDAALDRTRQVLGPWERCICRETPPSGMLVAVQDWLWMKLSELSEVGQNPLDGSIEIEAKIGTLLDVGTGDRLKWPVTSPVVVAEEFNKNLKFESRMVEAQHMAMNKFLNKTLQETMQKGNEAPSGRVPMQYKHIYETDSFEPLSALGFQSLPPAFQRRTGRELRLRTTVDDKTKQIKARIVKVHVANLHIYSPMDPYDCRITINLEANLDKPDLDPQALVEPPKDPSKASVDRQKDRLSYKHLAYSIDLTKVLIKGLGPQYELELEVDAGALRQQMELVAQNKENAYSAIVEGFLDNATYLMRNRP